MKEDTRIRVHKTRQAVIALVFNMILVGYVPGIIPDVEEQLESNFDVENGLTVKTVSSAGEKEKEGEKFF